MKKALAEARERWGDAEIIDEDSGRALPLRVANKPAGAACLECPLRNNVCVPTERTEEAKIAIVGEAPGANEVRKGRPFIGRSGQLLMSMLGRFGYSRDDVVWTNAALCEVRKEKELKLAAKQCAERLQRDLEGVQHVIPVGAYALQSVLRLRKKPPILKNRGFVFRDGERLVTPTVHPAFVLRAPQWEAVLHGDLDRAHRVRTRGWRPPEKMYGRRRVIVHTIEALRRELDKLEDTISIDVETTEEPATINKLICFSMTSLSGKNTVVVPWSLDMTGSGAYFGRRQGEVASLVTKALHKRTSITHNGPSFDHIVLSRYGIEVGHWEDTLIAHHAFAGHMPQRLSHVVSVYLDAPPWKDQREETIKDLYRYNSQDTIYTALAWSEMQNDLKEDRRVYEIDCMSSELCREMQENGFRYDVGRAEKLGKYLARRIKRAERRAARIIGHEINLASHVQLRKAFFEDLDAPIFFRSIKTGAPALNVDALRAYSGYADERLRDLSLTVIDYRKARKVKGTYIDPIQYDPMTHRVHPSWRSFGTVSGRFSCRQPNLMNLPRPGGDPTIELGGIRSLYIPAPGHTLVGFDLAQLEMRIAAYISGDEVMIRACETDDLHSANAALLFDKAFTETDPGCREWKMLRTIAKTSGFAIAYMASAPTVYARIIAQGLEITFEQVEALLKKMRGAFSTYYEWQDVSLHRTMKRGYVESPLVGRKRWLGFNPPPTENSNFSVQSGAADHMNLLLPKIAARIPKEVRLVAQVHDSAVFDVPERFEKEVMQIIREAADEPVRIRDRDVVFPIDLKAGSRWSDV